jgi:UPF0755 protein
VRLLGLVLLLVVAGLAAAFVWIQVPGPGPSQPLTLDFPRGTGSVAIANRLASEGVIPHPFAFHAARLLRRGRAIQAGEYHFEKPATTLSVVDRLVRGDVVHYEVTVPEGTNAFELQGILKKAGLPGADSILPRALAKEGMLFPAVYRYTKGASAAAILDQMEARFARAWREAGGNADDPRQREIVTLASLVETEARVAEERPVIASVYRNRLDRGMKLDCDPTVIYAALLEGKYRGTIYRSDLDRDHPYNTYQRTGLPPGPIANPGLDSLRAALRPASTNYLFFVARGDSSGRHVFSEDVSAHNRAVAEYRAREARSTPP